VELWFGLWMRGRTKTISEFPLAIAHILPSFFPSWQAQLVADSDLPSVKNWRFSVPTCCPYCLTISLPAASSEDSLTKSTSDALNFSAI
jgi:hypothetical protein